MFNNKNEELINKQIEFLQNLKENHTITSDELIELVLDNNAKFSKEILKNNKEFDVVTKEEYIGYLHSQGDSVNDTVNSTTITNNVGTPEITNISQEFHYGTTKVTLDYSTEKETDNGFRPEREFDLETAAVPKINNFEMFKFQDKFNQYKERMQHILNKKCDSSPEILIKYLEENPTVKDYINGKTDILTV
jgi:hypothetical protein